MFKTLNAGSEGLGRGLHLLRQCLHRQINGSTYALAFHTPFKVMFFPEISLCGIWGGLMNPVAMTTLFLAFS